MIDIQSSKGNRQDYIYILLAVTSISIFLGGVVAVLQSSYMIPVALIGLLVIFIYIIRVEVGLYLVICMLPLQNMEFVLGGLVGVSPVDLVLWPWLLIYTIRFISKKRTKGRIYNLVIFLLLASLLSGLVARNTSSWLVAFFSTGIYSLLMVYSYNEFSQKTGVLNLSFRLYVWVAVFVSTFGILQFFDIIPKLIDLSFLGTYIGSLEPGRIGSFLGNANFLAAYLVLPLLLSWSLATDRRNTYRTKYGIAFFIIVIGLLLTFSRAGFLAVSLGLGFLYVSRRIRMRNLIVGLVIILLVSGGLMAIYNRVFIETSRSGAISSVLQGNIEQADRSLRARFALAQMAIDMFRSSPLVGIGSGQFEKEFLRFRPPDFPYDKILNAHNTYLQVIAETGLIGFLTFTSILLYVISTALKSEAYKVGKNPYLRATLAAFISLCIIAFTHTLLRSEIWLVAGMVLASTHLVSNTELDDSQ